MSAVGLAERMVTRSQWAMPIRDGQRPKALPLLVRASTPP